MNMFGLEGSGFIIAISVCLLLVGAVVYYFNTRVANLEKALVKQNQVLADFIQNVKTSHIQERNMQMQVVEHSPPNEGVANGATQEAVIAARDYFSTEVPQEKVDVSDDEEEEDSSSEEDESELESEIADSTGADSTGDNNNVDDSTGDDNNGDDSNLVNSDSIEKTNVDVNSLIMSNNSAIIGAMLVDITGIEHVESLPVTEGPTVVELLDEEDSDNLNPDNLKPVEVKQEEAKHEEAKHEDKKIIKLGDVDDLDQVSSSLGSSLDDEEEDDGVTIDSRQENVITDFSKLKVAKLKELAAKVRIKNATKLKKAELVAALEANK